MTYRKRDYKYRDQFTPANSGNLESLICIRMDKFNPGREVYVLHPCETNGFWYTEGVKVGKGLSLRGSELLCIELHYPRAVFDKHPY